MWLSGSMQGWQPRGRWFKLSWGQSLFVGGNVRLGNVRLGIRDWEVAASFFLNIKKKLKNMKNILWSKTIISRMIAHVPIPGIIPP